MQFAYVAGMCVCAWLMGACFDVYNTITGSSRWLRWLRPVLDIAFWTVSAVFVFYVTFRTNQGEVRLYTYALLLAGYGLYAMTVHRRVVASAFAVVRFWKAVFRWTARVVNFTVIRPVGWTLRLSWLLLRQCYRLLCRVEDGLFWALGFWMRLFAFPFRPLWSRVRPVWEKGVQRWEGIWIWASNVLLQRTKQ
ncbi:MAG: spore cortex biosynthesis protein YabQ [Alicyclobacillaceae bacterium]|nr:spore cortex biosynthesis protein YabQ [Alicyclobacillaceae bacterium]